jgi:plastocyanin
MKRIPLPAAVACLALVAAGCGSSNSSSSSTSESSGPAPKGAIEMKNIAFSPKSKSVKVGQKVTWVNDDDVDHNVTTTGGAAKFASDNFGKGGTYSFTPTKPGTIQYTCTLHPGMDATLIVTQ